MIQILAGVNDVAGSNNVHPIGAIAVILASCAALVVPLRMLPLLFIGLAAAIPATQRIVIAGADFNFVRVLVLFSLARVLARGELAGIRWNAIDTCVLIGGVTRTLCFPIARGSASDFMMSIGSNYELLGVYIVIRCAIRSLDDVRNIAIQSAWVTVLVTPFFIIERTTGRNMFSVFGGIAEMTPVRDGRLRCKGAHPHAILAGCFFVAFLPLWLGIVIGRPGRERLIALLGIAAMFIIVVCCASSTPLVALLLGFGVWVAYPLRSQLRLLWISAIASGFVLHFIMNKPIWHLISRIDLVGGSTGNHRYRLIDAAIRRFGEWWMLGTAGTAHWGWGLHDVTNQFILEGVRGGRWAFLAMCGVLVLGYATVGTELRRMANLAAIATKRAAWSSLKRVQTDEALIFGVGAALCAQMAIFLAVSYFGQTVVVWQLLMAVAGSMRQWTSNPIPAQSSAVNGGSNPMNPTPRRFRSTRA